MYTAKVISKELREVLDKLRATAKTDEAVTSYAPSDILKAKTVLDRLLAMSDRNEVSHISKPANQISDI